LWRTWLLQLTHLRAPTPLPHAITRTRARTHTHTDTSKRALACQNHRFQSAKAKVALWGICHIMGTFGFWTALKWWPFFYCQVNTLQAALVSNKSIIQ
jgi:uncharacterized membrane protein (DUF2068 family)